MKTGYSFSTEGAVALAAGVAESVFGIKGNAAFGVDWLGFRLGFDGVTASAVPVTVELCYATFATNSPGTNSTSVTIRTNYGRAVASGMTAAKNWVAEPTVLTVFDEFVLTPNGGLIVREFPRDRTPDSAFAEGFVVRCTAAAIVNLRGGMWAERA